MRVKNKEERDEGSNIKKKEGNNLVIQEMGKDILVKSISKSKSISNTDPIIENQDAIDQSKVFDQVKKIKDLHQYNGNKLYFKMIDSIGFK